MSISRIIKSYLDRKNLAYEVLVHPKRDTALSTAQVDNIPCEQMLKAVIVKVKKKDLLIVVPANYMVDLYKLRDAFNVDDIYVESEYDFEKLFPDCERGAFPPLGPLYGLPCFLDVSFEDVKYVYFNAGTHTETIMMRFKDYCVAAEADLGDFAIPKETKHA